MSGQQAFGKKDLALFLSDTAGDVQSLRHTVDDSEMVFREGETATAKPKYDPNRKVRRWRKGEGAVEEDDGADESASDFLAESSEARKLHRNEGQKGKRGARRRSGSSSSSSSSDDTEDDDEESGKGKKKQPRKRISAAVVVRDGRLVMQIKKFVLEGR